MGVCSVPIDPDTGRRVGDPTPLATPASYVSGLSISADGRRVAYASVTRFSNSYRLGFDPAAGRALSVSVAVTSGSRVWASQNLSPDGQWIALASANPEDLFVCRIDGTELRQVTDDAFYDRSPRWGSDNRQIAFHSNRGGKYEIWSIDRDGANLRPLTQAENSQPVQPVWSPDGTRMLFSDFTQRTVTLFDPRKPWRDQSPEVLPQPTFDKENYFVPTSWSADGKRWSAAIGPARAS
jgi:Tol biopolymer transport system component